MCSSVVLSLPPLTATITLSVCVMRLYFSIVSLTVFSTLLIMESSVFSRICVGESMHVFIG